MLSDAYVYYWVRIGTFVYIIVALNCICRALYFKAMKYNKWFLGLIPGFGNILFFYDIKDRLFVITMATLLYLSNAWESMPLTIIAFAVRAYVQYTIYVREFIDDDRSDFGAKMLYVVFAPYRWKLQIQHALLCFDDDVVKGSNNSIKHKKSKIDILDDQF